MGGPGRQRTAADEILDLLVRRHLVCLEGGVARWYRWVACDNEPVIDKVRVTENGGVAA